MSKNKSSFNFSTAIGIGIGTFVAGIIAWELPLLYSLGIGAFGFAFSLLMDIVRGKKSK